MLLSEFLCILKLVALTTQYILHSTRTAELLTEDNVRELEIEITKLQDTVGKLSEKRDKIQSYVCCSMFDKNMDTSVLHKQPALFVCPET